LNAFLSADALQVVNQLTFHAPLGSGVDLQH
jgi:hypothetical protein